MKELSLYIDEIRESDEDKIAEMQLMAELNDIKSEEFNQTAVEEEMERLENLSSEVISVDDSTAGQSGTVNTSTVTAEQPVSNQKCQNKLKCMLLSAKTTNILLILIAVFLFCILCKMSKS